MNLLKSISKELKGKYARNFTYIHDYFQFDIEDYKFNLYGSFEIKQKGETIHLYLDNIEYRFIRIFESNDKLMIEFDNGIEIVMNKTIDKFIGPEWYEINGPNNLMIVETV